MSSSSHTIPLTSQVGGHSGVQTTEDGSLIIKPALPLEHQFYQSLTKDAAFESLRPFVSKFFGTLKLEGQVDDDATNKDGSIVLKEVEGSQKESLVLENLSHTFLQPNILDIKLGTVLYDEEAPEDKVTRMEKTARDTTSFETGVRLTGFQVYSNGMAVNTPKSYGKSITAAQLPEGIRKFFPDDALPTEMLLKIITALRDDIIEIKNVFAELEIRMVGGSLLIIYEADLEKAKEGIQWMEEEEDDEEEEEDDEGDDEEGERKKPTSPYLVKLIDFAHTRMKPGSGPDEGVLKGIQTVIDLLDGRIESLHR
ncbi:SAICAR synthase-like protein [Mycena floridula]|nr:SAICAR synthase-like protein [Mycena floridula]